MSGPRPTREDLDAADLRTVARHAIAPLERDLRRAEAKLAIASRPERCRSTADQIARLRAALDLAREIASGMEPRR